MPRLDEAEDCGARYNASVLCTLGAGHPGPHCDGENPHVGWYASQDDAREAEEVPRIEEK